MPLQQVDTIAQAIADVRATRARIDKGDAYAGKLGTLIDNATSAAEAVRSFLWSTRDRFDNAWMARSGALAAAQQSMAQRAPAYGFDSVQGRDAATADTNRTMLTGAQQATATEVLTDTVKDRAVKLASSFADAMRSLKTGIDSAIADYTGPASMRVTNTIERMQTIASTKREIESWQWPAKRSLEQFTGYVERAEDDKASLFMEASRPVLVKIRDTPQPKLAARYTLDGARTDASDERDAAWRLLQLFDQYARSRMPSSITIADRCRSGLVDVFSELCGVSQQFMNPSRFAQTYLSGSLPKAQPWEIDPGFVLRRLPPDDFPLPGWTPGCATQLGTIVRGRR